MWFDAKIWNCCRTKFFFCDPRHFCRIYNCSSVFVRHFPETLRNPSKALVLVSVRVQYSLFLYLFFLNLLDPLREWRRVFFWFFLSWARFLLPHFFSWAVRVWFSDKNKHRGFFPSVMNDKTTRISLHQIFGTYFDVPKNTCSPNPPIRSNHHPVCRAISKWRRLPPSQIYVGALFHLFPQFVRIFFGHVHKDTIIWGFAMIISLS